ncbi:MAG TPA: hypothetical protein VFM58_08195 [Solirubrobacteraceae bacterium]|nr:hypothetical protein [Solirubrobacteraceae bacterium]
MSFRTRKYVALLVVVGLAVALTRVSDAAGWSDLQMYAVGAAVLVVLCPVAMAWMEMAPDGAWRKPRR